MKAARHSQGMEQVLLLLSYGADVNAMTDARNDYRTVLHYAVLSGNIILVNLLLKQGAKVDKPAPFPEPDRPSPLDLAILRGDPALVRILLESGKSFDITVSLPDVFQSKCSLGANVNRCSPVIGSPLHVACADNIPHRVEIMKVNNWRKHYCHFTIVIIFTPDFGRCYSHTAPTQINVYKTKVQMPFCVHL